MRRGFLFAAVLFATLASGAFAQKDDALGALTPDAPAQSDEAAGSRFGGQVYRAIAEGPPEAAGAFMRDAVNSLGGLCTNTSAYQRVGAKSKLLTYKVQCGTKPLYLLTVDESGRMLANGGDGRVPPMRAADGPIYDAKTGKIEDAKQAEKQAHTPGNDEIPIDDVRKSGPVAASSVGAPEGSSKKLRIVIAGFALFLGFGTVAFFLRFSGHSNAAPKPTTGPRKYPSDLKDEMIAESPEIAPDVWEHSSGVYIVRGRHGKRRVFPSRRTAMIYHRWGYKFRQLR